MTHPNDPIYPVAGSGDGLTKREYFAGLAMQGLMTWDGPESDETWYVKRAVWAADALIAELNRK